jgi:hypothetical protein
MEDPVPDLKYYMQIAQNKGISEDIIKNKLIELMGETKSYIGSMKILMKLISKGELDIKHENKSMDNMG